MRKLILLTALFVGVGCGTNLPPQIEYVDRSLEDAVEIGDITVTRDAADLLYVTLPIRMKSNKTRSIDWRIAFYDAHDRPMSESSWSPKYLNANVTEYITANSLSPGAKDFRFNLRYSK